MKKITRVTTVCVLLIMLIALWSWKNFEDPGPIKYTRPANTRITLCGSAGMDWTDTTSVDVKI